MNIPVFLVIFSLLSMLYLVVGLFAGKNNKTQTDYFLANRTIPLIPLALTLVATQTGGALLLGTSQAAYHFGMWSILYTAGIAVGFLLLGFCFAPKMRSFNAETNAHVLEIAYHSSSMRTVASLISIAAMIGILVGQIVAVKTVFISMGLTQIWLPPLFWAIVLGYTLFGGLAAVVATDIIQAIIILGIFTGIVLYHSSIAYSFPTFWSHLLQYTDIPNDLSLSTLLLMPALFSLVEQDLAQRFFSARNSKTAAQGALLAGCCIILFSFVPIYLGTLARFMLPTLPSGASPLLSLLETIGGNFIPAIALCAITAAIISTSDSLLCAASSNAVQDFAWPKGSASSVHLSRLMTGFIGVLSLIISYWVPQNILHIMVQSYALCVYTLVVPSVAAYIFDKPNRTAAWGSIVFGSLAFLLIKIFRISRWDLFPLAASLLAYIITALMTRLYRHLKLW